MVSRFASKLFAHYKTALVKHPYAVQSVQTGALLWLGDVIAQKGLESKEYDKMRAARMTAMGIMIGPSVHVWYLTLERFLGKKKDLRTGLTKVAIDQLLFAPIVLVVFISTLSTLEGKSLSEIQTKVRAEFKDLIIANYKLWPAVQVINFTLVPVEYRVLFLQVVAVGWNTFLAWKLHMHEALETPQGKSK